jgi:RHS repeat-associated protein
MKSCAPFIHSFIVDERASNRLVTKATPEGTLNYTYYASGNVESITSSNPNGISVAYTYDDLNRLSTVVDHRLQGNQTTTYTYDPASNVAAAATPNGLTANFTYDALNRLTALTTPVASYSYTLGATGNRTAATEGNGRTLTWNYDGIYRLNNETISGDPDGNNGSASYNLDPVGNRSSMTSSLPGINSGSWGYNADDEISSETYDANGNVLATGGKTYAYDAENHMISANNGQFTMIYDGDGNRVSKTVNGVTTQYLVDDLNPTGYAQVVEEVVNNAVTRQYTYGLQRISQNLSPTVSGNSTWTPSFYVYDGGGSVRQLTNTAGTVTDEYLYDAFGNSFTKTGTTPNNYLYRGEQYDQDLGLYYLRARYYNPATGRFLSRDPEDGVSTDPATLHKYVYAGGDPVNSKDPTGHDAIAEYGIMTAAIFGTNVTVKQYDQYTGNYKITSGPSTIVALKLLSCSINTLYAGDALGVTTVAPVLFDFVECTAWKKDDCTTAPPEPSNSPVCKKYGNESYAGTSLQCFCKCAGDSTWADNVRGCLACEHNKGTNPFVAHMTCYAAAGPTNTPPETVYKCYTSCYVGFKPPVSVPPVLPPYPLPFK